MSNLVSIRVTQNNLLDRNGSQTVLDNVLDTSFRADSWSLSCPPSARTNNTAVTAICEAGSLYCVLPGSDACRPTRLDSTVWSRTQTSLGFVAEVAFEIRHTSTPLLVCRPSVVLRHVSTCPQVCCWNSDPSQSEFWKPSPRSEQLRTFHPFIRHVVQSKF